MKKILLFIVILLILFAGYFIFTKDKKAGPDSVKVSSIVTRKHSTAFNNSIDTLLGAYFKIKDAFVNADSNLAKTAATNLIILADSNKLIELKKDAEGIYQSAITQLSDVRANAESLVKQHDITEMRQDFRMIGESIYPLLKTINYDGKILYWQNCPMAFGDEKDANWISNTKEIYNPYLGKNHPEFKGSMLHCGEVKDSIQAK